MSSIDEHITIPANISYGNDLDFEYLRNVGQQYIEDLSRKFWTDYNIHDPGITVEEILCYAITELGLRIDQPIENLVAWPKEENFKKMHEQFKSAKNILTCKPVNHLDYRRLFIDIDGVKNCWMVKKKVKLFVECNSEKPRIEFQPFVNSVHKTSHVDVQGLYTLLVDFEKGPQYNNENIKREIRELYHKNRNLCEDLVDIKKVPKQCIRVCTEIQLEPEADEEYIDAQIQWTLSEYLSPGVKVQSLTDLLDASVPVDEIFQGPVLENGFITEEELKRSALRKQVRLSDIINLIMEIEGVKLIEDISIDNCPPGDEDSDCSKNIKAKSDPWVICVQENHVAVVCDKSVFKYKKGFLPIGIDKRRVKNYLKELKAEAYESSNKSYDDLPMPMGKYAKIKYETIQHNLPENYGISPYGLSGDVSNERKVLAKQLQGYLLFFDQVLSTYFSHLEHVKLLLIPNENLKRTYFFKAVEGIDGIEELVKDYTKYQENVELIIDNLEDLKVRRNALLDHLISRFAEVFEDYTSAMYKLFGRSVEKVENNIILTKNKFLKHYDKISSERGLAFNYTEPKFWDTDNVSGFQKRIALLSGIANYNRRDLFSKYLSVETIQKTGTDSKIYFEYRWQIRSETSIFLTSARNYATKQTAIDALLMALKLSTNKKNFVLGKTFAGNFYVTLKDRDNRMVARQFRHFYSIRSHAEKRRRETISFIHSIVFEEGFYMIENILTLPYKRKQIGNINQCLPLCIEDDCSGCSDPDPFSYQVTIVFPGYTSRFSNIDFRVYMENLIRRELPAHILPRICWIGHMDGAMAKIEEKQAADGSVSYEIIDEEEAYDMKQLQKNWKKFLKSKSRKGNGYMASHASTKDLLCTVNQLNTVYPNGVLHDCMDEETEINDKIILNRSALGSL